jgi:hypothetical protein
MLKPITYYQNFQLEKIFDNCIKCKLDFDEFLKKNTAISFTELNTLPFACSLGFIWGYFKEQGIDIDINNCSPEEIFSYLQDVIQQHEKTIDHYS